MCGRRGRYTPRLLMLDGPSLRHGQCAWTIHAHASRPTHMHVAPGRPGAHLHSRTAPPSGGCCCHGRGKEQGRNSVLPSPSLFVQAAPARQSG